MYQLSHGGYGSLRVESLFWLGGLKARQRLGNHSVFGTKKKRGSGEIWDETLLQLRC
jgi:hypothetical protein